MEMPGLVPCKCIFTANIDDGDDELAWALLRRMVVY